MPVDYYPVLLAFGVAIVLAVVILSLARLAGRGGSGGRVKHSVYESGLPPLDNNRKRVSIMFFLIAIDFVVFDVEAAFIYPWVLVLREGGWPLFWAVQVFVALILVGFIYLWRKGGLDVSPNRRPFPSIAANRERGRVA